MIAINMPGGAIRNIDEGDLLWMRKAFDGEWKGTVMIRLEDDRIYYSVESVQDLEKKFLASEVAVGQFTAPDARLKLFVSAKKVREVEEGNPAIYHEKARALLVFSEKMILAVRETVDDARRKLTEAVSAQLPAKHPDNPGDSRF
jgi:hypothetical protein